jgi:hypothetical protein
MNNILTLDILSDEYMSFIPDDLHYFSSHFDCNRIASHWAIPKYKIFNESKGVADIMCWMLHVPIVSERCKSFIEDSTKNVEFLPYIIIEGNQYYAVNVLECIDVIDLQKSGSVPELGFVAFKNIDIVPRLFRSLGNSGRPVNLLFMSKEFAQDAISLGLTGGEFIDPSENLMKKACE